MQSFRNSLLQHGSPSGSQVLPENLLQHGLLHRSAGPCPEPAPAWVSHGFTSLSWASTCSGMGLLYELQVDLCTPMVLHGLQGHSCFTMVCIMGCRRIAALAPGAPRPPPPSALTLVSVEFFLSRILTPLFSGHNYICAITFFLLKYVFTEALPPFQLGPALASSPSVLEPPGIGSADMEEASSSFSQKPSL